MSGPYTGRGWYSGGTGHYNSHSPPPHENPAAYTNSLVEIVKSSKGIAAKAIRILKGYEGFLQGRGENTGAITEFALLVVGNCLMEYAPQQMLRYEEVLNGLGNKTKINVDWVKKLLYGTLIESNRQQKGLSTLGVVASVDAQSKGDN